MKKEILVSFLVYILTFSVSFGQKSSEIETTRERTFTGKGLYGFMNGGTDLYLEYGVKKLDVKEVKFRGEDFVVEIYEMPSVNDAFGIYSQNVFKCQRKDSLRCVECFSPYQLQAVVGNKYISIVFPSGTSGARKNADDLFFMLFENSKNICPEIPEILSSIKPYSLKLKYLRGPISVSSANLELKDLLEDLRYSGIWFYFDENEKVNKALVNFIFEDDIQMLKERVPESQFDRIDCKSVLVKCKDKEVEKNNYGPFGF